MLKFEVEGTTSALAEAIWMLWTDVEGWKNRDVDVEYASINGKFRVGTRGILKTKGAPQSKFIITEATPTGALQPVVDCQCAR